jgi:hypothetical protein
MFDRFKDRTPAKGSAIDIMARARAKGEGLKTHHLVSNAFSIILGGEGWGLPRSEGGRQLVASAVAAGSAPQT